MPYVVLMPAQDHTHRRAAGLWESTDGNARMQGRARVSRASSGRPRLCLACPLCPVNTWLCRCSCSDLKASEIQNRNKTVKCNYHSRRDGVGFGNLSNNLWNQMDLDVSPSFCLFCVGNRILSTSLITNRHDSSHLIAPVCEEFDFPNHHFQQWPHFRCSGVAPPLPQPFWGRPPLLWNIYIWLSLNLLNFVFFL